MDEWVGVPVSEHVAKLLQQERVMEAFCNAFHAEFEREFVKRLESDFVITSR
jgi:predicted dinucleotide-binding enzyme